MKNFLTLLSFVAINIGSLTTLTAIAPSPSVRESSLMLPKIKVDGLYEEKIKLLGQETDVWENGKLQYATEYRGEIGLDLLKRKIMFNGNKMVFHSLYNGKKLTLKEKVYKIITIKDENNNEIIKIIINGMDNMQGIIEKYHLKNGIDYKDNYSIEVWSAETSRTWKWTQVISSEPTNTLTVKLGKSQFENLIPWVKEQEVKTKDLNNKVSELVANNKHLNVEKQVMETQLNGAMTEKEQLEINVKNMANEIQRLKAELKQIKETNASEIKSKEEENNTLLLKNSNLIKQLNDKVLELEKNKNCFNQEKQAIENELVSIATENNILKATLEQIKKLINLKALKNVLN